jgi:hypothetical protein
MFRAVKNDARPLHRFVRVICEVLADGFSFLRLAVASPAALRAEILFLRKQLAFYEERQTQPRRLTDGARASLVFWSRLFDWKDALVIVKPETLIGWHRKGFKLFSWPTGSRLPPPVACDFLVAITPRFQALYVFLMMEVRTRRIMHCNVTAHPTAAWTLQQFREAVSCDHPCRFLIHDRDSIFAAEVDEEPARLWAECIAHAGAGTASQCLLRTVGRDGAPGVPRLHNSARGKALAEDSPGVGIALQPRPTPSEPRAGNSRSQRAFSHRARSR